MVTLALTVSWCGRANGAVPLFPLCGPAAQQDVRRHRPRRGRFRHLHMPTMQGNRYPTQFTDKLYLFELWHQAKGKRNRRDARGDLHRRFADDLLRSGRLSRNVRSGSGLGRANHPVVANIPDCALAAKGTR